MAIKTIQLADDECSKSFSLVIGSIYMVIFIPMEQATIFEDNFGADLIRHRRHLLPVWAKIYCWIAMISGLLISTGIIYYIYYILQNFGVSLDLNPRRKFYFYVEYYYIVAMGLVIFTVPFLLWLGKKWAIDVNWILSALFVLPVILVQLRYPTETSSTLPVFLLLPIWIAQFMVQKKWKR